MLDSQAKIDPAFLGRYLVRDTDPTVWLSLTGDSATTVKVTADDGEMTSAVFAATSVPSLLSGLVDDRRIYLLLEPGRSRTPQLRILREQSRGDIVPTTSPAQWSELSGGVTKGATASDPGGWPVVNALAAAENDDIYAGGDFTRSSDGEVTDLGNIARYAGRWEPLGPGLNGQVRAIAVDRDNVYVGGSFTATADGSVQGLNNVARYSLSSQTWHPLTGNGLGGGRDGFRAVDALMLYGHDLYVGGEFTQTSSASAPDLNRIAVYSTQTQTWSAVGMGVDGPVHAIEIFDGGIVVGGSFSTAIGDPIDSTRWLAHFNGERWEALPAGGPNHPVHALFRSGGELYVGGARKDDDIPPAGEVAPGRAYRLGADKAWTELRGIPFGRVTDFEWLAGVLYAAGECWNSGESLMKLAGDSWSKLDQTPPSSGGRVYALQRLGPDLYTGGEFAPGTGDGAVKANNVASLRNAARPPAKSPTPAS